MIHIILIVSYLLLAVSFLIKERILGALSGFAIMTTGVFILINGISYMLDTLLVQALATISIGFGFYMLMSASFDIMEESL